MKKLVNKDPFSNGTELMQFNAYNCDKCIKGSKPRDGGDGLTFYTNEREDGMPKCSIQRDIDTRAIGQNYIKQETVDICQDFILHGTLCPYLETKRKKQQKKQQKKQPINQQKLEL